ncbi:MAG: hypothetical protein PHS41_03370 [Victivallaceae bacterium]|nr:hypothetical protein [Victivallaceae bacterium]
MAVRRKKTNSASRRKTASRGKKNLALTLAGGIVVLLLGAMLAGVFVIFSFDRPYERKTPDSFEIGRAALFFTQTTLNARGAYQKKRTMQGKTIALSPETLRSLLRMAEDGQGLLSPWIPGVSAPGPTRRYRLLARKGELVVDYMYAVGWNLALPLQVVCSPMIADGEWMLNVTSARAGWLSLPPRTVEARLGRELQNRYAEELAAVMKIVTRFELTSDGGALLSYSPYRLGEYL